jgi:hypothetical protein
LAVNKEFDNPVRLLATVTAADEAQRSITLFITGSGTAGQDRVERIPPEAFRWHLGQGTVTGERVYTAIESIEIHGLNQADRVKIQIAGATCLDRTLLLPLWAGIASPDHARSMMEQTICHPQHFWGAYGLRACATAQDQNDASRQGVHILWNTLVGEGLLSYGYRSESVALVTRLMSAITRTLRQDGNFRNWYHADTGVGGGERNALGGLPPLGLFLATLGVRVHSPWRVALDGLNPFPWPVTVKYRGLTVLCQKDKTTVIFPDGQTTTVDDPSPCVVRVDQE